MAICYSITPLICLFCLGIIRVQTQEMVWLGGNKLASQMSVGDAPGGRSGSGVWQDGNATMWMFGGMGTTATATATGGGSDMLNDLWRFGNVHQTWQQLHPGTVSNLSDAVFRAPEIPRPRQLAAVCGKGHVMVLFGGLDHNDDALGDLWVFDTQKKVWRMLVSSYAGKMANETDVDVQRDVGPEARGDSAGWCTGSHLYIFGGVNASNHIFSDMWRLSLQDLTWEELNSSVAAPASLRDHTTADYPAGRNGAMTWLSQSASDSGASLFLFGGNALSKYPRDRHMATGYTSDLWEYSVGTDTWRYAAGSIQPGRPAEYGRFGEPGPAGAPGCRRGAATWTDVNGMLWLFGGEGADLELPSDLHSAKLLSDLWRFHPKLDQWEWRGGSQKGDAPASFREKGRVSHAALPGGRVDAAAWKQVNGEAFFLFGGLGHDGLQHDGYLSDLWFIDISSTVGQRVSVPAVYGFSVVFIGVALVLCLSVVGLYSRDRSKPPQWRQGGMGTRYSQLHDSDT